MKYLVTWRVHKNKRHETLQAFSAMTDADDEKDLGGVRLIGRWHDLVGFTGAAIAETDDPEALTAWLLNWNAAIDIKSTVVLDDDEARAVGRELAG
jgi:hypothetical protein